MIIDEQMDEEQTELLRGVECLNGFRECVFDLVLLAGVDYASVPRWPRDRWLISLVRARVKKRERGS